MALIVGVVLALVVGFFASLIRLDRDRGFYPTVLIVVGSYYALFAAMGASREILILESVVGIGFLLAATWGFRSTLWIVVAGLAAHGLFDLTHGAFLTNPGVPSFWPAFCSTYDVTAAAYLAWRLRSGGMRTHP